MKIKMILFLIGILLVTASWGWGWGVRMQRQGMLDKIVDQHFSFTKHWGYFIILVGLIGFYIILSLNMWR